MRRATLHVKLTEQEAEAFARAAEAAGMTLSAWARQALRKLSGMNVADTLVERIRAEMAEPSDHPARPPRDTAAPATQNPRPWHHPKGWAP